jgi:DNA-nicking Smr family endonuclease
MSSKQIALPVRRAIRRRLTAEEEHLWLLVSRSIRPLRPGAVVGAATAEPAGIPGKAPRMPSATEEKPRAPAPSRKGPPLLPIARRELRELARGRRLIDARLDLHGLTQAEAHRAVLQFLHRAQASRARFVLVITGKGKSGAAGVLRNQVPLWLALPELRHCVLGFEVAHGHGGEGALYVRLRHAKP